MSPRHLRGAVVFLLVLAVSGEGASAAVRPGKVVHVVVALCDNQYQGIVPVPAKLGNGDDPANNLYWGAAFGTGLMAPEAYVLKAALDGWILGEDGEKTRNRAAGAYHKYQGCSLKSALKLFATGW